MNDPQPLGYADALGELERILAELEATDVDVDQLAPTAATPRAHRLVPYRISAARRIDQ
jgi:hypothetical protein